MSDKIINNIKFSIINCFLELQTNIIIIESSYMIKCIYNFQLMLQWDKMFQINIINRL